MEPYRHVPYGPNELVGGCIVGRIGYTPNRLHMDMDLWHRALGGFRGEPFPFVEVDFPDRARPVTFWTVGAGFGSHPPIGQEDANHMTPLVRALRTEALFPPLFSLAPFLFWARIWAGSSEYVTPPRQTSSVAAQFRRPYAGYPAR